MLRLRNPQSGQLEALPEGSGAPDRPVRIYVCGITPYDTTHLGHAFTYSAADVLVRYLEFTGRQVRYVQNVTDIDDDILKRAAQVGESWREVGDRWTAHFIEDMIALNVRPPDVYPRATEVIPEIQATVLALLEAGAAYAAGGSVYYRVDSFPEFGRISGMDREMMLTTANERGNNPDDPHKRDPLDFVLWQAAAPGEPAWDSPWGSGRPGWHIECSSMATKFLGETVDIHSGGSDLLFPHHCCEIAQIEPLTGQPFVRHWMHTAMVRHDGEKMSKSLGNLVWARELLETHRADSLRLYLSAHHYAIEWSHDPGLLSWAGLAAGRMAEAAALVSSDGQGRESFTGQAWNQRFGEAMDADLDTPRAIGIIDDLAVQILVRAASGADVRPAQGCLRELAGVLGLALDREPAREIAAGWSVHLSKFKTA
ncbi:MAG TPA: cysteine--tRNA ligase [Anaerolineales bacterium]|nr:cysteine--tRNA ligase [Anaerolineales bacterium]